MCIRDSIYICESRALDGGRPFVKNALASGHHVHFIPDTTMLSAMKKCQAVFIGAETIYPDGTVFNTIGSDIVAMLCGTIHKPLYVLTPLIKLDTVSYTHLDVYKRQFLQFIDTLFLLICFIITKII